MSSPSGRSITLNSTESGSRKARRTLTFAKKVERIIRSFPVLVLVCLIAVVGFGVLRKLVRPILIYRVEASEIRQIERELKALKSENAVLKKQTEYLKTPKGAQTEARKLGFVYPGEVSIILDNQPDKKKERN
jgi:cell division protein FtsB